MTTRGVLVIVGAGATTRLGRSTRGIPAMAGWAEAIIDKCPEEARAIGLSRGSDGEQFEATLGHFIHWRANLEGVRCGPGTLSAPDADEGWFATASKVANKLSEVVDASLLQLFGSEATDPTKAGSAYGPLLRQLPDTPCFITTNYDFAIEQALEHLGAGFFNGTYASFSESTARKVHLQDICSAPQVPVLHLHGAAGWYTNGSDVIAANSRRHCPEAYTPAVLLPDSSKKYESAYAANLRRQASSLFRDAERIIVIGHSLHDRLLTDLLREAAASSPIAVCLNFSGGYEITSGRKKADAFAARLSFDFQPIPLAFQPRPLIGRTELNRWLNGGDSIEIESAQLEELTA